MNIGSVIYQDVLRQSGIRAPRLGLAGLGGGTAACTCYGARHCGHMSMYVCVILINESIILI